MDQKVKLQISSDLEDVARIASVLLDEALMHVRDLASLITAGKDLLKEIDISNENDLLKLKKSVEMLSSAKYPVIKIDNRLADVVAIADGLSRVLAGDLTQQVEQKDELNDNVNAG